AGGRGAATAPAAGAAPPLSPAVGRPCARTAARPSGQLLLPPSSRTITQYAPATSPGTWSGAVRAGLARRHGAPLARAASRSVSDAETSTSGSGLMARRVIASLAGASLASGGVSSPPGPRNGAWGALCGVRPGGCGAVLIMGLPAG